MMVPGAQIMLVQHPHLRRVLDHVSLDVAKPFLATLGLCAYFDLNVEVGSPLEVSTFSSQFLPNGFTWLDFELGGV